MPKHLHVIGICGTATGALAIAFKEAGWSVTGSDKGFYPPVSTNLEQTGIPFYAGWHPEKMLEHGKPDLVIFGTATGSDNPESSKARELGLEIISDAEARGKYFVKENSIVVVGTWGKTSSAAILAHILREARLDPSFVIGGIPIGLEPAHLSNNPSTGSGQPQSGWSVIEGDEYKSGPTDPRPKFDYLPITHLLLTGVSWDHADVYPTEDAYFAAFERLVERVPEHGLIVACVDHPGVRKVIGLAKCKVITYGSRSTANYRYVKVGQSREGLRFGIMRGKEAYAVESPMLGTYQAENITGCFALACEIGLSPKDTLIAIASFAGIKRRLEKRLDGPISVLDCHAPTPEKAHAVLASIKEIYARPSSTSGQGTIVVIYEPNIGGRTSESAIKYTNAFSAADHVLIPRLTKLKIDKSANATTLNQPMEGRDLASLIARSHLSTRYIADDDKLVTEAITLATPAPNLEPGAPSPNDSVIAFLGSHGFRGMIEQTVSKLQKSEELK